MMTTTARATVTAVLIPIEAKQLRRRKDGMPGVDASTGLSKIGCDF